LGREEKFSEVAGQLNCTVEAVVFTKQYIQVGRDTACRRAVTILNMA
jgi:hypothetical protein